MGNVVLRVLSNPASADSVAPPTSHVENFQSSSKKKRVGKTHLWGGYPDSNTW